MNWQIIDGEYVKMRGNDVLPKNEDERSIENALAKLGVDREDLEFRTTYGSGTRYIRYRYWRSLPILDQQIFDLRLEEECDWDDDCGYRYCYLLG